MKNFAEEIGSWNIYEKIYSHLGNCLVKNNRIFQNQYHYNYIFSGLHSSFLYYFIIYMILIYIILLTSNDMWIFWVIAHLQHMHIVSNEVSVIFFSFCSTGDWTQGLSACEASTLPTELYRQHLWLFWRENIAFIIAYQREFGWHTLSK